MSAKTTYWFIFQNSQLLLLKDSDAQVLTAADMAPLKDQLTRQYRLIEADDRDVYCAEIPASLSLSEKFMTLSLRKSLELLGNDWFGLAAKAYSIILWDKNHQYCGRCGQVTTHSPNTFERRCTPCDLLFYPRISPSIMVLIQKGDELLMARSPHFPAGIYGLIAGFIEAGETAEEAVHREVKEEVGLTIKNLRYYGSQPWPFPDTLVIAFTADYVSGEINIDPIEIESAGWYRYDNLPYRTTTSISIAKRLIDHFVTQKEKSSLQ